MNNYEILGRLIVSIIATLAILFLGVGTWLGMMADVWKWGPLVK